MASSSSSNKIHYFAIARLSDKVTVADLLVVDNRDLSHKLIEDKRERVYHSGRVSQHNRLTITDKDVGLIHYDTDPQCIYLIMCTHDYDQRMAFKLLDELRNDFVSRFSSDLIAQARHSSLTRQSRESFVSIIEKYNRLENVDKVASVAMQVDEVKGVMQDNIQSVLRNQENIETLLDQTDTMKNEATGFQRSANRAKEKMWWKNIKLQIVIIIIVLVIIGAIVAAVVKNTGGGSSDNKSAGSSSTDTPSSDNKNTDHNGNESVFKKIPPSPSHAS